MKYLILLLVVVVVVVVCTVSASLPTTIEPVTTTDYWWPYVISQPLIKLLGEECYVVLFEEFQITHGQCIKLFISKGLGLGIVIGGAIVKIPQIITIVRYQSAKGISLTSFLLETIAYSIVLIYNTRLDNPFSTFGEVLFMTIQNIIISVLILYYSNDDKKYIGLLLLAAAVLFTVLVWIPWWCMMILYAIQIPISLASKVPQITTNYKNQSTGQLSVFAIFNYFIGTTARTFTTWAELDDPIMLGGNLLASILNGILVFQLILYWNKRPSTSPVLLPLSTKAD